jgi:hypothetical protein
MAALLLVPARRACLAFARLLLAGLLLPDKALARIGAPALVVAMRLRAPFDPFAIHALFVAACLLLAGLRLPDLLGLGPPAFGLPGIGLLSGALGVGTPFGLLAASIAARFGLAALLAGAVLRGPLSRFGFPALFAGTTLGLLASFPGAALRLLAHGLPRVLPVVATAFGLRPLLMFDARLVVLLVLVGAFAALVVAGDGGRGDAHGQDGGERNRDQELSGGNSFHVDHLCRAPWRRPGVHFARPA